MAQNQAEAGSTPLQAADPTNFNQPAARNAGDRVEGTDGSFAGNSLTEPSPNPAGDSAAGSDLDRLLAGATNLDALHRLTSQLLQNETRPEVSTGVLERDYPVPQGEETDAHPEDVARAVAEGKARPTRLRIGSLEQKRQEAIWALADPDRPIEEVLRGLAPAASTTAAPPPTPESIPGLPPVPSARPIDAATLLPPTESSEALRNKLASLREERKNARANMDYDSVDALEDEIASVQQRVPQAEQAETAHHHAIQASVRSQYPDSERDSALSREMIRIDQEWKRTGDPLHSHPSRMSIAAMQAGHNLGIAAQRAGAPVAPAAPLRPAPVAAHTPRAAAPGTLPVAPVAGGARTSAPSVAAAQEQFDQTLSAATDTNGILALTRLLG